MARWDEQDAKKHVDNLFCWLAYRMKCNSLTSYKSCFIAAIDQIIEYTSRIEEQADGN